MPRKGPFGTVRGELKPRKNDLLEPECWQPRKKQLGSYRKRGQLVSRSRKQPELKPQQTKLRQHKIKPKPLKNWQLKTKPAEQPWQKHPQQPEPRKEPEFEQPSWRVVFPPPKSIY